eukprot:1183270-Prorocentrum_minimum.AAC.2
MPSWKETLGGLFEQLRFSCQPHRAFAHQILLDDLHHRRQAVGGAGGSGDDVVLGWVVQLVVAPNHDVQDALRLHGRGDQNLLHTVGELKPKAGRNQTQTSTRQITFPH